MNSSGLSIPSKIPLRLAVEELVRSSGLLPNPGGVAVLAVSGGLDSTCMARILSAVVGSEGVRWVLAHAQHGLRPEDAEVELRAVRRMATDLGLELRVQKLQVCTDLLAEVGIEAAARQVRLGWLRELASELGANHVFLGHHRDDQLETILLRRAEGLPIELAAGMSPRRGLFCRPLLEVPRDDLAGLAHEQGWAWVEDPSNQDDRFLRNALRHNEIPTMKRRDPDWEGRVLREGQTARERADSLSRRASTRFETVLSRPTTASSSIRIERSSLAGAAVDELVWLFQRLCRPELEGGRPPGRRPLTALAKALGALGHAGTGESQVFDLGAGWAARLQQSELFLRRGSGPFALEGKCPTGARSLSVDRPLTWSPGLRLGMTEMSADSARSLLFGGGTNPGASFAVFDADQIALPLSVQGAALGRRMTPFGMEGKRSIRDVLADSGVPRVERAAYPLVLDASGTPLWLPGVRSSACAPLTTNSERAVMLYTVAAFGFDTAALEMDS